MAIALGAGGGSEGDSVAVPAATSTPSVAQSAASGGFVPVGRPAIETRLRHTATLLDDGRVLLAGGFTLNGSRAAELLDPASATFESTTATVEGRQSHEAIRLADGRVLLIGGTPFTGGGVLASTEVYHPSDGIFHATASMTDPRWDAAVVLLEDGRVLVAGGVIENLEDGSPVITDRAELYDPTSDTFVQTGPMHASRRTHNLTLLDDGRVLVTGGGPLEVYDPATGEFSLFGGEPVFGDEGAVATLLADGRVLISGIYDDPQARDRGDSTQAIAAYLVDPASGAIDRVGDLIAGRSQHHTGTLLPDGRVLIAGGVGGYGEQIVYPPNEVFDPSTGQFETIASTEDDQTPTGLRATNVAPHLPGHTATSLADGSVLLVGLIWTDVAPTLVVERFAPTADGGDDRFAEHQSSQPRPQATPGRILDADYTGVFGEGGTPLEKSTFLAAAGAKGLELRELTTGFGMCGEGAVGRFGAGMHASWADGRPGAENLALYVYESEAALAEHWTTDESGYVRPVTGTSCWEAFGGDIPLWENRTVLVNNNHVLLVDLLDGSLWTSDERDPDVRAALIEAFQSMQP